MLHKKTMPLVEKVSEFNKIAPLSEKLAKLGLACQLISFLTESYGTGYFIYDNSVASLGPFFSLMAAICISFPICFLIEYAVYELTIFCTSCLSGGWEEFLESSGTLKVLFWIALLVLITSISTSIFLSKKSVTFAFTHKEIIDKVDIKEIEIEKKNEIKSVRERYARSENKEKKLFADNKESISKKYAALIKNKNLELDIWIRKEEREKKSYRTKKILINQSIAKLEREKAEEMLAYGKGIVDGNSQSTKSMEDEIFVINKRYDVRIQEANETNSSSKKQKTEVLTWFAFFIRSLAGLSVIGFVCCRVWVQLAYDEVGIKRKNYYTPAFFESSILQDVVLFLKIKVIQYVQNPIRRRIEESPTLLKINKNKNFVAIEDHKKEIDRLRKSEASKLEAQKAEAEAENQRQQKAEAEARQKAEAEAEARRKAEAEAEFVKAENEKRRKAEAEAREAFVAAALAKQKAEAEAEAVRVENQKIRKAKAEAEAAAKAEAEVRRKAEAEAAKAEAEAREKSEAARKKAEAAIQQKAEAEAAKAEAIRQKAILLKAEAEAAKAEAEVAKAELLKMQEKSRREAEAAKSKAEANTSRIIRRVPAKKVKKESGDKKVMKSKMLKFINKHKAKHGKLPKQQLTADHLGTTTRTIYEYTKELKEEGSIL